MVEANSTPSHLVMVMYHFHCLPAVNKEEYKDKEVEKKGKQSNDKINMRGAEMLAPFLFAVFAYMEMVVMNE